MSGTEADIEFLESLLSPERIERIDYVLQMRLRGLTAVLEDVHHPQNMGACIRTLEAIGIQDVHCVELRDRFVPNEKITQGCHKWVDLHRHKSTLDAVHLLRARGFRIVTTSLHAEKTIDELDYSTPMALCFGNELDGVTDELVSLSDETFKIPMYGFTQSFNLSVALALCMNTAARARRSHIGALTDLDDADRAALRDLWIRRACKNTRKIEEALVRQDKHTSDQ